MNAVHFDTGIRHRSGRGNAEQGGRAAERARNLFGAVLTRLKHLRFVRRGGCLTIFCATEKNAGPVRPAHRTMLLLEGISKVFRLLAGERSGELDDAAEGAALTEKELRESVERLAEAERVTDKIDAAASAQLAGQEQLSQVNHLIIRNDDAALINVILGPERHAVALHFDEARVQHDEAGDALIITENTDKGVAVHQ